MKFSVFGVIVVKILILVEFMYVEQVCLRTYLYIGCLIYAMLCASSALEGALHIKDVKRAVEGTAHVREATKDAREIA